MSKEALPCPFCGSTKLALWQPCTDGGIGVRCHACHTTMDARAKDEEGAVEAWNTRTSHLPDREEVLQEVLQGLRMLALVNGETASADWHNGVQAAIGEVSRLSLMERKA